MKNKDLELKKECLVLDYINYLNDLCIHNKREYHYAMFSSKYTYRIWYNDKTMDKIGSNIDFIKCLQILEYEIIIEEHHKGE